MTETIHTLPIDDLIDHVTDGADCPCGPTTEPVERVDGTIGWHVIHHSLDGREHSEPDHDHDACPSCSTRASAH